MSARLNAAFAKLKTDKRAALVPFIMAGDPDVSTTEALLAALPGMGADVVELGMPFSDPMADGPTIQTAGQRALAAGMTVSGVLGLARHFRALHADTPLILMGYANPVAYYGVEKFCKDAADAGVDGLIIVDVPLEERAWIAEHMKAAGLALIPLIAPTTDDARRAAVLKDASGFAYVISVTGTTGNKTPDMTPLTKQLGALKKQTDLPLVAGFGISEPSQVEILVPHADGVVIGSALIRAIAGKQGAAAVAAAEQFLAPFTKSLS